MSHTTRLKLLKTEVAAPAAASKVAPASVPMLNDTREARLGDWNVALQVQSGSEQLGECVQLQRAK
jgi:hypothetical protein